MFRYLLAVVVVIIVAVVLGNICKCVRLHYILFLAILLLYIVALLQNP